MVSLKILFALRFSEVLEEAKVEVKACVRSTICKQTLFLFE